MSMQTYHFKCSKLVADWMKKEREMIRNCNGKKIFRCKQFYSSISGIDYFGIRHGWIIF